MKNWTPFVIGAALLVAIACGGGGGGGSSTTSGTTSGTTAGGLTDVRIEGVLPNTYRADFNNIQVADTIALGLWGRDADGQVAYATASNFSTNAPSSVATVSGSTLTVIAASATTYRVFANGTTYSVNFRPKARAAALTGRVRNTTSQGVPDADVYFFSASGANVGSAVTGSDGTFRAVLPTTARTFLVDLGDISTRYYNQFGFGPSEYSVICPANKANLPTLVSGSTVALSGNAVVYRKVSGTTPPPPPPDCGL